ncbi:hypothetical protein ASE17_12885 [Phenylobacterium sp. Root77]|uniref:acyltransferase family protein n=1 Tax=unclassified Phenylobacterium TaxID=2640670 RepID=UPI0006F69E15|nr:MULTISPECIES: acyltransferase [unclassified Phenylobacterium]KQW69196.1 hypothetical protein ASC73_14750 [Phenylobacterium sp. Root1277]KQW95437.1 hypothetical protein ASC79_06935 [Phenylobacterium sp. Root1290]KRC41227.1 hypothetical protein ASE17_12885 [Phenylobacterium sp. Root77]
MRAQQFYTLHALRGVIAFVIIAVHTELLMWGTQPHFMVGAVIGVDLFFTLSGFVLMHTYEKRLKSGLGGRKFLWQRLVRLYPLYFLGFAIGVAAMAVNIRFGPDHLDREVVLSVLTNLVLLPGITDNPEQSLFPANFPAWTLFFEFIMCGVFGFFAYRFSIRQLAVAVGVSGAILAFLVGRHSTMDLGPEWGTFFGGGARAAFGFFNGMLLYKLRERAGGGRVVQSNLMALSLIGLMILSFLPGVNEHVIGESRFATLNLILLMVFNPMLIWFAAQYEPSPRLAKIGLFLGGISYGVYVLHVPLYRMAEALAGATGVNLATYAPWAGIAVFPVVLGSAWLAERYFDVPVRALIEGKHRRGGPPKGGAPKLARDTSGAQRG